MNIPPLSSTTSQDALLTICLFAAFADGDKSDEEREEVRRLAAEVGPANTADLSRQILMRKATMESAIAALGGQNERLLAYEMALGICEAGGSVSRDEEDFLKLLRSQLGLDGAAAEAVEQEVASVAMVPVTPEPASPNPEPATDHPDNCGMILKYSILNGALELLPETLATMAIIPMQMKMVYRIGKSHGVELGRSNIKEFLATAGLGLGSQMVEGFARKIMKGVGKKLAGKMAGKAADQITGSAFSFASTYAIGHVAEKYYSSGRTMDSAKLKSLFVPLQDQARQLHTKYIPEIQERAKTLTPSSILSMVAGSKGV